MERSSPFNGKPAGRAVRRHHAERLRVKRRHYWGGRWRALDARFLAMLLHTPALCSKFCCGNPRKWMGERTMQERRFFQSDLSRAD